MVEGDSAPSAPQEKGWLESNWKILLIIAAVAVVGGIILLDTFGAVGGEDRDKVPVIVEQMPPRSWGELVSHMEADETFEVFVMEAFCLDMTETKKVFVNLEGAGQNPNYRYPSGEAIVGGEVMRYSLTHRQTSWAKIQQVVETDKVFATYWVWLTGISQEEIASYLLLEEQGWEVSWAFPSGDVQLVPRNRGAYLLGTQETTPVCPPSQPVAPFQPPVTQPPVTQPAQPGVTDIQSVSPGEARVWASPPFKLYWELESGIIHGDYWQETSGSPVNGAVIQTWMPSPPGLVRPVLEVQGQLYYGAWV